MSDYLAFVTIEKSRNLASNMAGWVSYLPVEFQEYALKYLRDFWEAYDVYKSPTIDEYKRSRKAALSKMILEMEDIDDPA